MIDEQLDEGPITRLPRQWRNWWGLFYDDRPWKMIWSREGATRYPSQDDAVQGFAEGEREHPPALWPPPHHTGPYVHVRYLGGYPEGERP